MQVISGIGRVYEVRENKRLNINVIIDTRGSAHKLNQGRGGCHSSLRYTFVGYVKGNITEMHVEEKIVGIVSKYEKFLNRCPIDDRVSVCNGFQVNDAGELVRF